MTAAKLTLEEARKQGRCRICAEPVESGAQPRDWQFRFRVLVWPSPLVLNYGKEFAHQKCLQGKD